jgi:cytochrome c oxidase assembly protein subunit 19
MLRDEFKNLGYAEPESSAKGPEPEKGAKGELRW